MVPNNPRRVRRRGGLTPQGLATQELRAKIATLYVRGLAQHQIAAELRCTQQNVSKHLKAIQAEWRADRAVQIDDFKARQLRRLDEIFREAFGAWERSNDAKLLSVATHAIAEQNKLVGAYAAAQAPIGPDGKPVIPQITVVYEERTPDSAAKANP